MVACFRDATVRDVLVEEDAAYVLTAREAGGGGFRGAVYACSDPGLARWRAVADVPLPAMPMSLAKLGPAFYVGLANRGYDPVSYSDHRRGGYAYADRVSGGVWQLLPWP